MAKKGTPKGHLDIQKDAIENALDRQMYLLLQASGGQDQYYIRTALYVISSFPV